MVVEQAFNSEVDRSESNRNLGELFSQLGTVPTQVYLAVTKWIPDCLMGQDSQD
jgi:glutaminase